MGSKEDPWLHEVEGALKRYHRADELARHPVHRWPAVRERISRNTGPVEAARHVLRAALKELTLAYPTAAAVLHDRYLRGEAIALQSLERGRDASTLHRQRTWAIAELAVVLAQHNRRAERRARLQRFSVNHHVVGVEPLVAHLVARLRDEAAPPVLVLEGMGGLGKTTIATLVARHFVDDDTFARVLWASAQQAQFDHWAGRQYALRPRAIDPVDILRQLAQELAIATPGDPDTLQAEVVARCKGRRSLIVLDNLETVADMAALGLLLGALAGSSRVLITTRDRAPQALPADLPRQYVSLNELDAPTSVQLLRSAATVTGAKALTDAGDDELLRIYQVTGGNPLALWLVAGQATNIPWRTFVDDLIAHCPRASTGYELYDFLYRRSWDQLHDDAKIVLFAMHRCEGGAPYDLLHALSGLAHDAFVAAVDELRRRMLLLFDGTLYTIHRLTYTFVRVVVAGWWA